MAEEVEESCRRKAFLKHLRLEICDWKQQHGENSFMDYLYFRQRRCAGHRPFPLELQFVEYMFNGCIMNQFWYLKQMDSVDKYKKEWEQIKIWADIAYDYDFSEEFLVQLFVDGLRVDIGDRVKFSSPKNLDQAFSLAFEYEKEVAMKLFDEITQTKYGETSDILRVSQGLEYLYDGMSRLKVTEFTEESVVMDTPMPESSTRKVATIDKDIISEMPRNLLEIILDFLPIQDAVRTSILSRNWRHCWTRISHLHFDSQFLSSMRSKLSHCDDPRLKAYEYVGVINNVLLLHSGPILKISFELLEGCDAQTISNYINQWIPSLARNGIKQFTLENSDVGDYGVYDFNVSHFSCLELTHLKLRNVWFDSTPAFGGFTHLTNLELVGAINYKRHIFDCPALERLILINCTGLFHTNFCAPKLECLHERSSQLFLAGLENLRELLFCFRVLNSQQRESCNVVRILSCLHKIEKFSVGKYVLQRLSAGGSPDGICKPLPYLKKLDVSGVNFADLSEISCLLFLIRRAPNLCKLEISALCTQSGDEETVENYWVEESEDCTLSQLEIVTISHLKGFRAEMELIKFLLAHSPSLKTMFIHRSVAVGMEAALIMAEEMLQFPRASTRAQIRHLKHPVIIDGLGRYETFIA